MGQLYSDTFDKLALFFDPQIRFTGAQLILVGTIA